VHGDPVIAVCRVSMVALSLMGETVLLAVLLELFRDVAHFCV